MAAVRYLEGEGRNLDNVLVVGGLEVADARLVQTTLDCAAGWRWSSTHVLDEAEERWEQLPDRREVEEILCVRNWQDVNVSLFERYPEARKLCYGDGLGLVDVAEREGALRVEEAVVTLPQVDRVGAADGLRLRVIDRSFIEGAIEGVRSVSRRLVDHDAELAGFGEGGLLILTANLTEAGMATPRAEGLQFVRLAKRMLRPGTPIVIKGHPRATLGQASALARSLRRRGHPVRVVDDELLAYPIEAFSSLARSVGVVLPGPSSSAISLNYLHGSKVDPVLPFGLATTTIFPTAARALRQVVEHHRLALASLRGWDGESVLESMPVDPPALAERLIGELPKRVLGWKPSGNRVGAPVDLGGVEHTLRERSAGEGFDLVVDRRSAAVWSVPPDSGAALEDALSTAGDDPATRITQVARLLSALEGWSEANLAAVVLTSTHLPRLRVPWVQPSGSPSNATLTAERIEQIVESHLEIRSREPGIGSGRFRSRAVPVRYSLRPPEYPRGLLNA